MPNKKLFYAYVSGHKVYTHAANSNQAATAIGTKTKCMLKPQQVVEVKPLYIYTFARKTCELDRTSYEECLAKSEKQAWFYFLKSRGKQWFAHIDSVRLASKDDISRLKEGELYEAIH